MPRYKKKPLLIDAIQWWKLGDHPAVKEVDGKWNDYIPVKNGAAGLIEDEYGSICFVFPGDYIICSDDGEVSVCRPDTFDETYELA